MTSNEIKKVAREVANEMKYGKKDINNNHDKEDIFFDYYHTDKSTQLLKFYCARLDDSEVDLLTVYLKDIVDKKLTKKRKIDKIKSNINKTKFENFLLMFLAGISVFLIILLFIAIISMAISGNQ
ncbi:MAG: hypothetical protein ACOC1K_08400 [Nanoarchaeota archaeon]